jgi:hypothetical protein
METEKAIRKLEVKMQAPLRILATKKLKQISASSSQHNTSTKRHHTP